MCYLVSLTQQRFCQIWEFQSRMWYVPRNWPAKLQKLLFEEQSVVNYQNLSPKFDNYLLYIFS